MKWLILLFGIASNASASLLIKLALQPTQAPAEEGFSWHLLFNLGLWLGISLYGLAFLLYALALKHFPLNIAHPILTTGALAAVAILSVVVLEESFKPMMMVGLAFVVLGSILLASGQH